MAEEEGFALVFCKAIRFEYFYALQKTSVINNDLLQATMLRIRATNRTIVVYVRYARFSQMQALASLFACGQPRDRGVDCEAVRASHTSLLKSHYCTQ